MINIQRRQTLGLSHHTFHDDALHTHTRTGTRSPPEESGGFDFCTAKSSRSLEASTLWLSSMVITDKRCFFVLVVASRAARRGGARTKHIPHTIHGCTALQQRNQSPTRAHMRCGTAPRHVSIRNRISRYSRVECTRRGSRGCITIRHRGHRPTPQLACGKLLSGRKTNGYPCRHTLAIRRSARSGRAAVWRWRLYLAHVSWMAATIGRASPCVWAHISARSAECLSACVDHSPQCAMCAL